MTFSPSSLYLVTFELYTMFSRVATVRLSFSQLEDKYKNWSYRLLIMTVMLTVLDQLSIKRKVQILFQSMTYWLLYNLAYRNPRKFAKYLENTYITVQPRGRMPHGESRYPPPFQKKFNGAMYVLKQISMNLVRIMQHRRGTTG